MGYQLNGNWDEGWALAKSTLYSYPQTDSEGEIIRYFNGKPKFKTVRCEIGQAMYELKNNSSSDDGEYLINVSCNFLRDEWGISNEIDCIITTPSSKFRALQPVKYLAKGIAEQLKKPFSNEVLKKTSKDQVKGLSVDEKRKALTGAIEKKKKFKKKVNILLVDDLYETGSTLNACVNKLKTDLNIDKIYVLCMTINKKTVERGEF